VKDAGRPGEGRPAESGSGHRLQRRDPQLAGALGEPLDHLLVKGNPGAPARLDLLGLRQARIEDTLLSLGGRGGPQDSNAAKAYYERAAALGNEDAKTALKRASCPLTIRDKQGKFVTDLCW